MARFNRILVGLNEEGTALAALVNGQIPVRCGMIARADAVGALGS